MIGWCIWCGIGAPDLGAGGVGAGVQARDGSLFAIALAGAEMASRQLDDVQLQSGDVIELVLSARATPCVDVRRNGAFMTRLWLSALAAGCWPFRDHVVRAVVP